MREALVNGVKDYDGWNWNNMYDKGDKIIVERENVDVNQNYINNNNN